MLTLTKVFEALAARKIDYFIWVATQKVIAKLSLLVAFAGSLLNIRLKFALPLSIRRSYQTNQKSFISRVIDQLVRYRSDILSERAARLTTIPRFFDFSQFVELASAIGDRVPGPCFVTVNPQTQNDIRSIVEAARRLHRTFTEQGVPRELVVSVCIGIFYSNTSHQTTLKIFPSDCSY